MTIYNASSLFVVALTMTAPVVRAEDAKPWSVERLDSYVAGCRLVPDMCSKPDPQAADAARVEVSRLFAAGDREGFAAALAKYDFLLTPEQKAQAEVALKRSAPEKEEAAAELEGPVVPGRPGDLRDAVGLGGAGLGALFDNAKPGAGADAFAGDSASGLPPASARAPAAARPRVHGTAVTPIPFGRGRKGMDFDTQELSAADASGRPAAARRLAATMLERPSGGKPDQRRVSSLARFLEIAVKDRGAEDPPIRAQVTPTGSFQLLTPLSDGSIKVRSAAFEEGTRWKGRKSGEALVVREAGSYKDGVLTTDPRRRIELFPNGRALQWVDVESERGYGPFERSTKTRTTKLRLLERRARDGGWRELGVEVKDEDKQTAPGTSGVERLGRTAAEAPFIKQFLGAAHWAGGGIKRGVGLLGFGLGAAETKAGQWTGFQWLKDAGARSELEGLAANENGKHLEPEEFVKRSAEVYSGLDDNQRRQWDEEVYQLRESRLNRQRERLGEKTYQDLLYRKVEDFERAVALAERLGMGNNGAYIARLASRSSGFSRTALTAAGGLVTIAEGTAESAPLIVLSGGTGALAKAAAGTRMAGAATAGHLAFHGVNSALMVTGAAGNAMTLQEGLADNDPEKVAAGSQAVLDMLFLAKSAGELKKWYEDRRTIDRRMTQAANGWNEPAPVSATNVPAEVRRRMDTYVPPPAPTPAELRAKLSAPATPFRNGNKLPKTGGADDAALRMVESMREEQHAVGTVRGKLEGWGLKLPKEEEDRIREAVRELQAANSDYDGYHGRRHQVGRNSVANMAFENMVVERPAGMSDADFAKAMVSIYRGAAFHDYDLAVTQTAHGVTTVKGAPATDPVRVNRRFNIVERPEGISDADLRVALKKAAKEGRINADESPEGSVDVGGKTVRYRYGFDVLPHGLKLAPPDGVGPEAARNAAAGAYRTGGLLGGRGTIKTKIDGKDVEIPYENPDVSPGRYPKTDISRLGEPLFTVEKPSGGTESYYPKAADTRSDVRKTTELRRRSDPKADPLEEYTVRKTAFSPEELADNKRRMPALIEEIRRRYGADAERVIALADRAGEQVHKTDFLNHYVQRGRLANGHERSALFDGESLGREFRHPFVNKEGSFGFMNVVAKDYAQYMSERATPQQRQALMRNWVDMKLVAGRKDLVGADMEHLNRQLNENPAVRNLYEVADRLAADNVPLQDAWSKISQLNVSEAHLTARP